MAAGGDPAAMAALMQAYVGAGDLAGAQAWLDAALAADPASRPARLMQAGLMATRGEAAEAEALYRALIAEEAAEAQPHQGLVALLAETGRRDAAAAALAEGIAATGGDPGLLLLQAGLAESTGDFEGAIAAYETLYARDSADLVVANNLASLLSAHRTDPESLERAFAAARRLRGSDVPQFQDTYGWILHRRGDSAQAAPLLAAAAAALPGDALVQYHHGEAEFALGRRDAAAEAFRRAIAAAGDGPQAALPQIAAARDRLAEIEAAAAPAAPAVVTGTPDGG
jgi:tetratricopeptide (TPR) repeat protein